MPQVPTVLGPVEVTSLGRTLMHEHIFILTADVQQNYPEEWGDEDARVADAVNQLRDLAAVGITTIVDVTVIGQGRYVPRIRRVAKQVPELNIVVATGCYTFDDVPMFFWRRTPEVEASLGRPARDHSGDVDLPDYLEAMAGAGLTLGMDRFGIDHFASFTARADLVIELCRRGLADRMVLSHDYSCYLDWFPPGSLDDLTNWHYRHVSQDLLPYLRSHRVTDEQIEAMLVRAPARILGGSPG